MGSKSVWFLILGILLFVLRLATVSQPHFVSGTKVRITATLRGEPKTVGQTQSFSLAGIKIKTWRYPEYHYGDRLEVVGRVKNGRQMEDVEAIRVIGGGGGFGGRILAFRQKIEAIYRRFLPEPHASLVSGIVLGSKSGMPADFYQNLAKTGTVHMVVASGMNVVIVGNILLALLLLCVGRRLAATLSLLGIWSYVLLAGAETPVLRAGIMGSLIFLAQGLGREVDTWRGLFLAGAAILLANPFSFFDLGFQLSFTATAGLLFFGPRISKLLRRLPKTIQATLSQTLGAQIATFPLILLNFGQYSFLSPLTNLLVVPVLPLVMELGMLVAIIGLLSGFLGQVFAWFLLPFLTYFVAVVNLFARI